MDLFAWKRPPEVARPVSRRADVLTPFLDRFNCRIAVGDYLYDEDGEIVSAYDVFEGVGDLKYETAGVKWRYINATPHNMFKFSQLPDVRVEDRVEALNEWILFEHVMPSVCATAISLKNGATIIGDGPNRAPAFRKTVEYQRQPTEQEAMMMIYGETVDLTEKKEVAEIHEECMALARHGGKYTPYSQQLIAAWSILKCKRMALWMDMRTGKTLSSMIAAKELLERGEIDHILVMCPVTNMYDPWGPELDDAGFITHILDGTKEEDYDAIHDRGMINAYVINYERLRDRMWEMFDAWDWSRVMMIVDETSAVKNPYSRRAQAFHKCTARAEYVALLNGTPMEQGPHDIWSQMRGVDRWGLKFGRDFGDFSDTWLDQYAPGKWAVQKGLRMDFEVTLSLYGIRYIRAEADQFLGKDKQFRHVPLKPTEEMLNQMVKINEGYLESFDELGNAVKENMTECLIRTYGFLREVCCSYDKFRTEEEGPYRRTRHEIDPKIMWVEAFLSGQPGTPLIIFCEFTEQEQRLKERLTELRIPFSSTRPMMQKKMVPVITPSVSNEAWCEIQDRFPDDFIVQSVMAPFGSADVPMPMAMRYHKGAIKYLQVSYPEFVKYVPEYTDRGPYPAHERKTQIDDFNEGRSHVFIMKWVQGRGMSLHRKPAVMNGIGTWPAIISMAPPWSLGSWDQGQDRAVVTDPATGRNVCTMIYNLTIKGSFEDKKIMTALREKKQVQAALLQDNAREGYSNFVSNLIEDMREAMSSGDGYFDATEVDARIKLGVPPYSKLTESLIVNKAKTKFKCRTKDDVMQHIESDKVLHSAYLYLMGNIA